METTNTATLEQFRDALTTVATLGQAVAEQEEALLAQGAEALGAILKDLHPVMRYIDGPIRASGHCPGGQFSHWVYRLLPEHGIVLAGDGPEELRPNGDQNRGDYGGESLVLVRSGTLLHRTFVGSWSRWQGESEGWSAGPRDDDEEYYGFEEAAVGSTNAVTPAEALRHFELEEILKGIVGAIEKAIKKARTKERTLAGRLERMEAVRAALAS